MITIKTTQLKQFKIIRNNNIHSIPSSLCGIIHLQSLCEAGEARR